MNLHLRRRQQHLVNNNNNEELVTRKRISSRMMYTYCKYPAIAILFSGFLYSFFAIGIYLGEAISDKVLSDPSDNTTGGPTYAIIHMGPHKTGSTSIQHASKKYIEQLRQDQYEMPWAVNREKFREKSTVSRQNQNQVNFATCFIPSTDEERKEWPCDSDLLLSGLDIARRRKNLFVSAETFDKIDFAGVDMLHSYLSQWDNVMIVISCRRFYSLLASIYNELTKDRTHSHSHGSIIDFTIAHLKETNYQTLPSQHVSSLPNLLERVNTQFGMDNITIINYHMNDPVEAMFCQTMPNAVHTCNAITQLSHIAVANPSKDLTYDNLVYGAIEKGLISITTDHKLSEISLAARTYQENTLNLTSSDLSHICLPSEVANDLLLVSLDYERKMKKLFPRVLEGMNDLESDFGATLSKFCKVDIEKTLSDEGWRNLFQSLNTTNY